MRRNNIKQAAIEAEARAIKALKLAGVEEAEIKEAIQSTRSLPEKIASLHQMMVGRILARPNQFPGCPDECECCGSGLFLATRRIFSNQSGEVFCSARCRLKAI